jgi:DNA-binding MarR family transcriptional regulator
MDAPTAFTSDQESRAHDAQHHSLRLWLRLLSCTTHIEDHVRQRLRHKFGTSLPRFDLLAQLERHPKGITMGELSRRLMVSGGNVTALVDQLQAEAAVQRHHAPDDRRSIRVTLTPAGRRQFARMAREHEEWVMELFDQVEPERLRQLFELLGELKHSVRQRAGVLDQE